jgi:hypothetical protein
VHVTSVSTMKILIRRRAVKGTNGGGEKTGGIRPLNI